MQSSTLNVINTIIRKSVHFMEKIQLKSIMVMHVSLCDANQDYNNIIIIILLVT